MTTILIANRGEIAVRVHRAAASLGLRTVSVFTSDDRTARHVQLSDEAVPLTSAAGYLDADELIEIAVRRECSLVHPGYGFLSENADFASRCADAGLIFVGPTPHVLKLLGDKASARALAVSLGIPVLPATDSGVSAEEALRFLDALGPNAQVMSRRSRVEVAEGTSHRRSSAGCTGSHEDGTCSHRGVFGNRRRCRRRGGIPRSGR
jgi:acetyl/propionyl-CoA carboxylase alpha subunit